MLKRNEDSNKQIYEFDFGTKSNKVFSYITMMFINASVVVLSWAIMVIAYFLIKNYIDDAVLSNVIFKSVYVIVAVFSAYMLLLIFFPRKVILTDDKIKIRRNAFPHYYVTRLFNDSIKYSKIVHCKILENHSYHAPTKPFAYINWDNLVEIKDENDRKFYVPVKNAGDFVNEVNRRVEAAAQKESLNTEKTQNPNSAANPVSVKDNSDMPPKNLNLPILTGKYNIKEKICLFFGIVSVAAGAVLYVFWVENILTFIPALMLILFGIFLIMHSIGHFKWSERTVEFLILGGILLIWLYYHMHS